MIHHSREESSPNAKDRQGRRTDWQQNDRRKSRPWVADSSDRRSGFDRRLQDRQRERHE